MTQFKPDLSIHFQSFSKIRSHSVHRKGIELYHYTWKYCKYSVWYNDTAHHDLFPGCRQRSNLRCHSFCLLVYSLHILTQDADRDHDRHKYLYSTASRSPGQAFPRGSAYLSASCWCCLRACCAACRPSCLDDRTSKSLLSWPWIRLLPVTR